MALGCYAWAQAPGNINTVAGTGINGYLGDGGPATGAQLDHANRIALDSSGSLYITDTFNRRIRKVDAVSGVISTVAGTGTAGYSGDGGLATSAQLNAPNGIAVDGSGNLYIADAGNQRIRKVDAVSGVISTVAGTGTAGYSGDGGLATSAQLNAPNGIAVDGSGNLYIADAGNQRIRKVDAVSGVISTVAGTGTAGYSGDGGLATSAELYDPYGIIVDGSGNLYIADTDNNRIRKVDAVSGVISTVAGTGTYGYLGDGGLAPSAELASPKDVAVDNSGNVYITDFNNNRIRKVDAMSGVISTVAGTGTAGYSGDGGLATSARLYSPYGVTVDSSSNLYIADAGNNRIRKVNLAGPPVGILTIMSLHSGKSLDVLNASTADGAAIQQFRYLGYANQQWQAVPLGDGYYQIVNALSGKVLDVTGASLENGAPVQQYFYFGYPNQQWRLDQQTDGSFVIVNRLSGKVLDVRGKSIDDQARLQQWDWNGGDHQKWTMTTVQYFTFTGRMSGKVLDVRGHSLLDGARVQQWDYLGGANQQWQLMPVGNGYYEILNRESGQALDETYGIGDGAPVQQYRYLGYANQQWKLVPTQNGYYQVVNRWSGRVLDVTGYSTANGTGVQMYTWLGGDNQQWQITPVTPQ